MTVEEGLDKAIGFLKNVLTHEKLDKDRFRRDLGGVENAYREIMKRIFGE